MTDARVTAAVLVIGDEILSGRTKDTNSGYIAPFPPPSSASSQREMRVVPDVEEEIVAALNALRARYTYVFTTGGIGPTHDDITADCVAKAFGVGISEDPRAIALLLRADRAGQAERGAPAHGANPDGAELVANPLSKAPGFWIGNVIVMAGVPSVMQVMMDDVAPKLVKGAKILSETVDSQGLPEGAYADGLGRLAKELPDVSIGSYPRLIEGKFVNQIVLRARDEALLAAAAEKTRAMLAEVLARHRL